MDEMTPRYRWRLAGQLSAARNGVTEAEVIDALYAPAHSRFTNRLSSTLWWVAGLSSTGRVIWVEITRPGSNTNVWYIVQAIELKGDALDQWYREVR